MIIAFSEDTFDGFEYNYDNNYEVVFGLKKKFSSIVSKVPLLKLSANMEHQKSLMKMVTVIPYYD